MAEEMAGGELEGLNGFDGVAVAAQLRSAIDSLLASRPEAEFRQRVEGAVERTRHKLEELGEDRMAQALAGGQGGGGQ
jgi:hypothetical protein